MNRSRASLAFAVVMSSGVLACSSDESAPSGASGAGGSSVADASGGSAGTSSGDDAGHDGSGGAAGGSADAEAGAPVQWLAAKVDGNSKATFLASQDKFETWLGRKMDAFIAFTAMDHWTDQSAEFIDMKYFVGLHGPMNVPVIWQIALCPNDLGTINYLVEVAAGEHDDEFTRAAKVLSDFRPEDHFVYIRLGHEFNGNWYSWGQKTIDEVPNANGVQPADFVSAFQRVVDLFRAEDGQARFRFVWNASLRFGTGAGAYAESFYPGDQYVDVISFDIYWDEPTSSDPETFFGLARDAPAGLQWHVDFAESHGKPIAFDEWGANDDGGPFVDGMAAWFADHKPLWHGYWDSNSGYQGKISDGLSGTTGERYRAHFGP